jgi:hypothetical protein
MNLRGFQEVSSTTHYRFASEALDASRVSIRERGAAATDEAGCLASLVRRLDAIMDEVHAIELREVNR